ncbi:MAG: Na+/H+ antiporter NhaC family protein [Cyanobacteria bacterium J06634_5]
MNIHRNSASGNASDLVAVLLVSGCLLVSSALKGVFIAYPLLLSLLLLLAALMRRGFDVRSLLRMGLAGARQALPVVNVLLLIGIVTAVWMAAGTVPALVYYGIGLIAPRFFILWAFLLCGAVSMLLGTSFGTVGTIGVALMVMARSSGETVMPVAGAIIAGAFLGDRCSVLSSSAHLVASVTHTSIYRNLRLMMVSSLWPFLLSLLFYGALSLFYPVTLGKNLIAAELPRAFVLSPGVLLPALSVLLLAIVRVDVKLAMLASIGIGWAIAYATQHYSVLQLMRFTLFGFSMPEGTPLQPILIGGGLLPMAKATLVVFISTAFAGIFAGSRILGFVDGWLRRQLSYQQLGRATVFVAIAANVFGCTQTIAILMTGQLMQPHYQRYYQLLLAENKGIAKGKPEKGEPAKTVPAKTAPAKTAEQNRAEHKGNEAMAIALEDTAVVIAPLIPWNIAGLIPATVLAVGPGFIPYCVYLILLPVFVLLRTRPEPIRAQSLSLECPSTV